MGKLQNFSAIHKPQVEPVSSQPAPAVTVPEDKPASAGQRKPAKRKAKARRKAKAA